MEHIFTLSERLVAVRSATTNNARHARLRYYVVI